MDKKDLYQFINDGNGERALERNNLKSNLIIRTDRKGLHELERREVMIYVRKKC